MGKHRQRRERRERYHEMLDAELNQEKPFVNRVLGTLNRGGQDFGPDGRPIKADFWRYIESRRKQKTIHTSLAALSLIERAINTVRVRAPGV